MVIAMVSFRNDSLPSSKGPDVQMSGLKQDGRVIFGQKYRRLVELKEKYDTDNIFSKSHLGANMVKA